MFRPIATAILIGALGVTACDSTPTATALATGDDYALVMFGELGAALEGTMGAQPGHHPVDGRSGRPTLPAELALTAAQREAIAALRDAFSAEHAEALGQLKAIFDAARSARQAGESREAVRAILETARPIAEALRPAVRALHDAIWNVHTEAQRAWIIANRPKMPTPMGGGRRP